jgi:hypothetical protein
MDEGSPLALLRQAGVNLDLLGAFVLIGAALLTFFG